mmetsp:Transcript_2747/g.5289  ORF Transcript_2747/g.5289 Transcript_2747/m.5289 type:complete len:94 (+) Transcript_2747:2162-2443(+)
MRHELMISPDPSHISLSTAPYDIQFSCVLGLFPRALVNGDGKLPVRDHGIGKLMYNGTPSASAICHPENAGGFAIIASARNDEWRAVNAKPGP